MQGKVHVAIGVATTACIAIKYPQGFELASVSIIPWLSILTAAAGSYAPDVDNPRTHSGQRHKITSKVISKVGGGHRGITHTLLFPLIFLGVAWAAWHFLTPYPVLATIVCSLIFGFELGWLMHIFADLFNGKGCPILWPFLRHKIHIMDLPSSGAGPWIFAVVLIAIEVVILVGGFL